MAKNSTISLHTVIATWMVHDNNNKQLENHLLDLEGEYESNEEDEEGCCSDKRNNLLSMMEQNNLRN